MIKEFKEFLSRGIVIDLAIAVVLGGAFTALITSLVNNVEIGVVAAMFGKRNFDSLTLSVGEGVIDYGKFLTSLIYFLHVGIALFFVVKVLQSLSNLRKHNEELEEIDKEIVKAEYTEIDLLTEIRDALVKRD